jgi:glycosyltransferase involved in cell wall biosynthesis
MRISQSNSPGDRLKVVIVSRAPFVGGAEVAAERLALGLQQRGHETLFILGQSGAVRDRLESKGLRCVVMPIEYTGKANFFRYFQARRAVRHLLKREQADVLHINDLPSAQLFADAARGLPIARITHHRFLYVPEAIDWFNKFGADRQVFVSHALMRELCDRSRTLASQSCEVLYDGLELPAPRTDAVRAAARATLGLDADRTVVLFAGQVIEAKGVGELVKAWSTLSADQQAKADLVIIGDDLQNKGAYRKQMQSLAEQLHVPARFMGFRKDVPTWLQAADIAVVPSHVEPLGNATLEAMSHGLPVVGSNVGGIPEMIVDGGTGLLVPPREDGDLARAIATLIDDPGLRELLGSAGRQRIEKLFNLDVHIDNVLTLYRSLISSTRNAEKAA